MIACEQLKDLKYGVVFLLVCCIPLMRSLQGVVAVKHFVNLSPKLKGAFEYFLIVSEKEEENLLTFLRMNSCLFKHRKCIYRKVLRKALISSLFFYVLGSSWSSDWCDKILKIPLGQRNTYLKFNLNTNLIKMHLFGSTLAIHSEIFGTMNCLEFLIDFLYSNRVPESHFTINFSIRIQIQHQNYFVLFQILI